MGWVRGSSAILGEAALGLARSPGAAFAPPPRCIRTASSCPCAVEGLAMPLVQTMLHPRGLHPTEAARAWHLHEEEGVVLRDICKEVTNMSGETPSVKAVCHAIRMVKADLNITAT